MFPRSPRKRLGNLRLVPVSFMGINKLRKEFLNPEVFIEKRTLTVELMQKFIAAVVGQSSRDHVRQYDGSGVFVTPGTDKLVGEVLVKVISSPPCTGERHAVDSQGFYRKEQRPSLKISREVRFSHRVVLTTAG